MTDLGLRRHTTAARSGHFLRLMNYHNTPRSTSVELRAELSGLAASFYSPTLADVDDFFATGVWPTDRPVMMPVFYEGYYNSAEVAGRICDELGLTAWFPICTGFIDTPPAEQEFFARSHHIGLVAEELSEPRLAMTWDQVADLSLRHVVTPHTASHVGINDISTEADFEREIHAPKIVLDSVTGQSAPAFAWLHGTSFGLSERHDRALQDAGYRYLIGNTMIHRIN